MSTKKKVLGAPRLEIPNTSIRITITKKEKEKLRKMSESGGGTISGLGGFFFRKGLGSK